MADKTVEINLKVNSTGTANITETRKALEMLAETATKTAGAVQTLAGSHNISQGLSSNAQAAANRMIDLQKQASAAASAVEKLGTSKLPVDDYVRLNTALRQAESAIVGASKAQEKLVMNMAKNNAGAASSNIETMHKNMTAADQALWSVNTKMAQLAGEANKVNNAVNNVNKGLAQKNSHLDGSFWRVAKLVVAYQAIYSVINLIGKGFGLWKDTLLTGLNAVEEYRMTIVGGAALLTSLTDKSVPIDEAYKNNKEYMTWFVQATKEVDKYVAAGAEDIQKAGREMLSWGVAPRTIEDVKSLGMMVDALKVATAGMGNQSGQLFTEIRNLFMGKGANLRGSQLLQTFMKVDHDVIARMAEIRENMKKTQDPTEFFNYTNKLLRGYAAASGDIQMMLGSLQSTATSTFKTVMVSAFGEAYDSIVKYGWALLDLIQYEGRLTDTGEKLAAAIRNVWDVVSKKVDSWVNEIIKDPDKLVNDLGSIFVAVGNIGSAFITVVSNAAKFVELIESISKNPVVMALIGAALGAKLGPVGAVGGGLAGLTASASIRAGSTDTSLQSSTEQLQDSLLYAAPEAAAMVSASGNDFAKDVTDSGDTLSSSVNKAGSSFGDSVVSSANTFAMIVAGAIDTATFGIAGAVDHLNRATNAQREMQALQKAGTQYTEQGQLAESAAKRVFARDNRMSPMYAVEGYIAMQEHSKQAAVKPSKYGSGVYDPTKTKGRGGGGAESEARRLMSLFDTMNKDIARLSEGKFAEIDANLTKTIDQIYNRQTQKAVSHEELVVLAKKRAALQKEKVEDEYQMYIAKGDASGIEQENQRYKEALKNFGNTEAKKLKLAEDHKSKLAVLDMKSREESLSFQKSYIDAAAQVAPTIESQLKFQKQALELDMQINDLKLEQARESGKIKDNEYNIAKNLKLQTDEARKQAQIREGWKTQGMAGGISAYDYELGKKRETFGYDTGLQLMQGVHDFLSQNIASGIIGYLKGDQVSLSELGWGIADSFVQKFVENWVNQVMPLISDLMKNVANWLSSAFGGGGGSFLTSLFGGGSGSGVPGLSMEAASGWAKGGAFSTSGFIPFAHGGVVSRPTVFPFARGTGLMGERGPEGILPLTRLPNGNLGVQSSAKDDSGGITVNVINNSSTPLQGNAQKGGNNREFILMLDELNANLIKGGSKTSKAINQVTGTRPPTRAR